MLARLETMYLGYSLTPFGHHPRAWEHARNVEKLGFDALLAQVTAAESAGFDFVLLADRMGLRPAETLSSVATPFEPTLLASALASKTSRIGLVAAAAMAQHEPYNLARRFASLDLIGKGRLGWLAIPSGELARDAEYLDVVTGLWDSYEPDAFLYDKAEGRFFDPEKMHVLNHKGAHFSVRGPLNVNPSPQGRPIVAQVFDGAGAPIAGDVLFLGARSVEDLTAMTEDAVQAVAASGKKRGDVRILANLVPVIGETAEAADAASAALAFVEADRAEQPLSGIRVVGTADTIAGRMTELATSLGLDGFTLLPPTLDMARIFVTDVAPKLVRRGSVGEGETLRGRLSLPHPIHPAKEA
jgi:alkanesulfonate monooxygenase SsuD/methylene tetrahydromethanopterin reductase-like flavin-dependent oxidoreductase (luciferase family)